MDLWRSRYISCSAPIWFALQRTLTGAWRLRELIEFYKLRVYLRNSFRHVESEYGAQRATVVIMWIINWNATSGHPVTAGHRMTRPGTRSLRESPSDSIINPGRICVLIMKSRAAEIGWRNFSRGIFSRRHYGRIGSLPFIFRNSFAFVGEGRRASCPREESSIFSLLSSRRQLEKPGTLILRLWYRAHGSTNSDILDRVSLCQP